MVSGILAGYMSDKGYIGKPWNPLYITGSKAFLISLKDLLSKIIDVYKIHIYEISEDEHRFVITNSEEIDCLYEWIKR